MSEFLSRSLFWITFLGFILLGISVLQIPELQEQISRLFQLLPQVFVAILILFVGILAANFLSRAALLAAVNGGYRSPRLWSGMVRFVIWILTISMALEQVGLARQTVVAAFSIVFGAVMLRWRNRFWSWRTRPRSPDARAIRGRPGEAAREGRGAISALSCLALVNLLWSTLLWLSPDLPGGRWAVREGQSSDGAATGGLNR